MKDDLPCSWQTVPSGFPPGTLEVGRIPLSHQPGNVSSSRDEGLGFPEAFPTCRTSGLERVR